MGRHPLTGKHGSLEQWPYIGRCEVCGRKQYLTPSGPTCGEHGGAETIIPESPDLTVGLVSMQEAENLRDIIVAGRRQAKPEHEPNPYPKMSEGTTVEVKMAPAFARILEHVYKVDPWKDYSELEDALKIGGRGYTDHETLMGALNGAEDNARVAHQLYCAARAEQERWELNAQVVEGVARRAVLRDLEAEKEAGQRKKQITEADVSAYIQLKYPDEYDRLRLTRLKLRKLVEHMERLAELWSSRCRSLQAMLGKSR